MPNTYTPTPTELVTVTEPVDGDNAYGPGGPGGGGSRRIVTQCPVTPATGYTMTIGAGGAGGATNGVAGSNGGDTTFKVTAGSTLRTARGGSKAAGNASDSGASTYRVGAGGKPVHGTVDPTGATFASADPAIAVNLWPASVPVRGRA